MEQLVQPTLTTIGENVLAKRYLVRNEAGDVVETPQERFVNVAKHVARAERNYGVEPDSIWPRFYKLMARRDFMPNTPCLVNAGRDDNPGQLSACFVLPIDDSMEGIFTTLRDMAMIHKTGGGCIGGESTVLTDHGPVTMRELVDKRLPYRVLSYTDPGTQFTAIGDYHETLVEDGRVYEVTLDGGAAIRASDWHPFFVWRYDHVEQLRADALQVGDAIIGSTRWSGGVIPTLSERAWLAGFIVSDGGFDQSVNGLRLRICKGYEGPIKRAAAVLGINYGPSKDPRYESPVWECCTVGHKAEDALALVKSFGNKPFDVYNKRLPTWIWEANLDEQLSLLVGLLDGDGWFQNDHNGFFYGTVSKHLADEIEALAGMIGLRTRRRIVPEDEVKNEKSMYEIAFARSPWFVDLMKAHSTRHTPSWGWTKGVVPLGRKYLSRLVELGYPVNTTEGWRKGIEINGHRVAIQRYRMERLATREVAALILNACGEPDLAAAVHSARIVTAVAPARSGDTLYDLTVPGPQNYVAGCRGFVVAHNTGFSFSRLRPAGDFVKSTTGIASGPVSFMRAYNHVTECVKQSGVRRGANMGILRIDHPDILSFIDCKRDPTELCNFNISVGITNAFMKAVDEDTDYELVNPRTKEVTGTLRARDVWTRVVKNAHASGEPGLFFLDRVNELDPLAGAVGEVEACNPCGEVPLRPYDACDLGSINLANFYLDDAVGAKIDFKRLAEVIQDAVRFLDDVHDVNQYPVSQIHEQTRASRKIGLGVMGWADLLVKMGIPYGSQQALDLAEEVERFVSTKAIEASEELAALRGPFPLFEKSKHFVNGRKHRRNATCTVIAPTGSISIIAGCSSGIEPLFAIVQTRKQADMEMVDVNPMFVEVAKREGFYSEELLERVKENGTVKDDPDVPTRWQRVFAIANEISPEYHIRMQAAFQRHVEDAVSKCLAAGTLIPTSTGLRPVESFSDVTTDDTFQKVNEHITTGGHRILSHYRLGIRPAVRIRLDNGAVLTGAEATHRVQTADGWKLMRDLRVGDVVIGRFMEAHGVGSTAIHWTDEWHTNASRIVTPKAMNAPLAEWLGMLCADGHTIESTGQVGLSCKDKDVEARFVVLTNEIFGVGPRIVEDSRTGVHCIYLTSRNLVRYVEALIGKGAFEKRAPSQVLQGSADEKRAFLRGVTLDGYLTRGALCVYGGMSETLAYHVAETARSFGLPSVYQGCKNAPGGVFHYVVLSNAVQEIVQCIEKHKNVPPATTAYKVLLDRAVLDQHVPTDHPHYGAVRSLRQETDRHYCTDRVARAMGWSTNVPIYLVRAVEDAGLVEMFDIEVEDAHEYVVNGIVSHNTINLPEDATVEDVEQAYRMAWDEGCKGITVYRDKSREGQTLTIGTSIARPELHPIPTGVYDLLGQMVKTPTGKLSVKVGLDTNDRPFETWLAVSRAGTAVSADCEAIARLGSLVLRMDSPIKPERRLQLIADQLAGIGGGDSVGFGQDRVLSLPDGVAKALRSLAEALEARYAAKTVTPVEALAKAVTEPLAAVKPSNGHNGNGKSNGNGHKHRFGDICPDCHQVALYYGEGCAKCALCGFSRC